MSGFLRLANEFIERMMNSSFGPLVNDDYSMRLGELLGDDRSFDLLVAETRRLDRVDELSAHTWMWLVTTPEAAAGLSRELLLELCRSFQAAAFRTTVIECAMWGHPRLEADEEIRFDRPPTLRDIEDPWLSELVNSTVRPRDSRIRDETGGPATEGVREPSQYEDAQSLLVALLTVNRRECHEAAAALLHHEWDGQHALLEFFEVRTAAMDEESRSRWLRLRPVL